jgi:hypothetical protein
MEQPASGPWVPGLISSAASLQGNTKLITTEPVDAKFNKSTPNVTISAAEQVCCSASSDAQPIYINSYKTVAPSFVFATAR